MMNLTPYRRGNSLFSLMDEMERSFFNNSVSGQVAFRTDISETNGKYLMEAELPGFSPEDINIQVADDTLTISATHEMSEEQKDNAGNYIRQERRYGSFSRSFDVSGIDVDNIEADYQNGVLKLVLPKREEQKPQARKIAIGGGKQADTKMQVEQASAQEETQPQPPSDAPVQ